MMATKIRTAVAGAQGVEEVVCLTTMTHLSGESKEEVAAIKI